MLTRSVSELQIVRVADNQTGRCWADGQKVVVLSPAEHDRLLAEAKEQGAREALAEFGRRLALSRQKVHEVTGHWPELTIMGTCGVWGFGFLDGDGPGGQWCADHDLDSTSCGRDPDKAMLKFLAAVQTAAAPKPCPCRTLGPSDWITKRNLWGYNIATGPDSGRTVYACPGELCPKCHKPLPPKPPEAMTIEECAAECRAAVQGSYSETLRCLPPGRCEPQWVIDLYAGGPGGRGFIVKGNACLDAWQAAVRKLREGGS